MGSSLLSFVVFAAVAGSVVLYLLPVLIGRARQVPGLGAVAVLNVLLGWTVFGWVLALAMALRTVSPSSPVLAAGRPGSPPPLVLPSRPGRPADRT